MNYLFFITLAALILSFIVDKNKTIAGIKIAIKKLKNIIPQFLLMLILVSVVLYLLPEDTISKYLTGSNIFLNTLLAALIGSLAMLPGFIAFPLCGILLSQGVSYMVIAAFSTSLMMVGFVSFPVEKKYYGFKLALKRNLFSFCIALIVALAVAFVFGEIRI